MKIAILEDRIERLNHYIGFDIKKYVGVDIITGKEFYEAAASLSKNDLSPFSLYSCIAAHRSAYSDEQRSNLIAYCRESKKALIFFSGGISTSVLKTDGFSFLLINSKNFYSDNLRQFIEDVQNNKQINLQILQFGIRWKLNLLLNLRNIITVKNIAGKIKRVSDLGISPLIKNDLVKISHSTASLLSGNELEIITPAQVKALQTTINRLIIANT